MNKTNKAIIEIFNRGYRATSSGEILNPSGEIRKLGVAKGYKRFTIRTKKDYVSIPVHRFVAYQKFNSELFSSDIQVRHLDGNPLNNSFDNIAIGTASDNMMDKTPEIRLKMALNATQYVKKHNHEQIIQLYKKERSYKKVMEKFNIKSKGTLNFILKKSTAIQ
jgi:hypothetical protein